MRIVCLATTLFAMWAVFATPATADELPNCVLDDAISASSGLAQVIKHESSPKVRLARVQPWLPIELSTSLLQPAQCCKICRGQSPRELVYQAEPHMHKTAGINRATLPAETKGADFRAWDYQSLGRLIQAA